MRTKLAALAAVAVVLYFSIGTPAGETVPARLALAIANVTAIDRCAMAEDNGRDPEYRPAVLVIRGNRVTAVARAGYGVAGEACIPLGGGDDARAMCPPAPVPVAPVLHAPTAARSV